MLFSMIDPDGKYRIERINFGAAPILQRPYAFARTTGAAAAAAPGLEQAAAANIDVAQKIQVTANVTFAARAPAQ